MSRKNFLIIEPVSFAIEKLGKVIRSKRESLGLSQESLAALSNLNRNYIGEAERGEVNISFVTLEKIAGGLGIKLSELILLYEQENSQRKNK